MTAVPFYCDYALCAGHISHIQVCSLSSSQTIKENIMGSIADKSINDVKANAVALAEDVQETVEETVEHVEERVDSLSTVKRFLSRHDTVVEVEDGEVVTITSDSIV
jgi:predicted transcriptional regulator